MNKREKKRRERYPDSSVFHYKNENPYGKITGDCVIRALSTVLNQTWFTTYSELADMGKKSGYSMGSTTLMNKYLKFKGFYKHKQPRNLDNTKLTGEEFCTILQEGDIAPYVNVIANIGAGHVTAIINGRINDTWDCSENCIGSYWTDSEEELY